MQSCDESKDVLAILTMKILSEDQFDKVKASLRLSEIGEVMRLHSLNASTVKLVDVCFTYAEYVQSVQFQDHAEYIMPVTNNDLMRELKVIKDMLERLELSR